MDGQVYGQPLYMWGSNIAGKGIHNVVFVVTEHDSVYAFDADNNTGSNAAPLWQTSFINPAAGVTSVPADNLGCKVITPEVGITSTPVIDPITGTLYVVAMTLEDFGQTYVHRLHALDSATGAERPGSPVEIAAAAPGIGDGNTLVTFQPWLYKERAGLLLLNGVVLAWSSHCDAGGYHGWLIGYDAKTSPARNCLHQHSELGSRVHLAKRSGAGGRRERQHIRCHRQWYLRCRARRRGSHG